ncbi:MAG: ATP-binding protein, partial [Terrabacter sp.]
GPASEEGCDFTPEALDEMYAVTAGYPYFIQAYGKVVWDVAPSSPVTAQDIRVAVPEAESELAVGFFGSRFERATPAEREYLRAMADAAIVNPSEPQADSRGDRSGEAGEAAYARDGVQEREAVPTSAVADVLGRKPQSLSPARDALIKKGLIYSGERGLIAFTVPHFGRYLRTQS